MTRSNIHVNFVISLIFGIIFFAAISKLSKNEDFNSKVVMKTRGSEDIEVIESTFIESRELVQPGDSTHSLNHYKISNYNAETEISAMQKFKKTVFPDWLVENSINFGRSLAFWKEDKNNAEGRNGRTLTNYNSQIDNLENVAMVIGLVAGVLFSIAVIVIKKQEQTNDVKPKAKVNTV